MSGRTVPDGYIKENAPHGLSWGAFSVLRHFCVLKLPHVGVILFSSLKKFSEFLSSAGAYESVGGGVALRSSSHIPHMCAYCSAFAQLVGFLQAR